MNIVIIISGNISKAPYLAYYTNFLKNYPVSYDIIYWDRLGIDEGWPLCFKEPSSEGKGYLKRFLNYISYRNYIIGILKKNKYDKIIIVTIALGVMLFKYLKNYYPQNYIFDIRDYSITSRLLKLKFRNLIKNSYASFISSRDFRKWLPKGFHFEIVHNIPITINNIKIFEIQKKIPFSDHQKLKKITTIGTLRDFNSNRHLMLSLKNQNNFILSFVGAGPAYYPLRAYATKEKISNVFFFGAYKNDEEAKLIADADFLNILTNNDLNSRTLTTNRFYLSVFYGIPMLVYEDTYQGKLCNDYNLGCVIKRNENIADKLREYIVCFESQIYNKGRKKFIELVIRDTEKLENTLKNFIIC